MTSLSDNWDLIRQLMIDNSQKKKKKKQNYNYEARLSRTKISKEEFDLERLRQPLDPILKDEGKQVLE